MKKDIHTTYHSDAKIRCACGAEYKIGSTAKEIKVEICSNCHPFYTGKQKLVDTARRVEKFEAKVAKKSEVAQTRKGKTAKKAALKEKRLTKVAVRKTVKKIGSGRRSQHSDKLKSGTPDAASGKASDVKAKPAAKKTAKPKTAAKEKKKEDSK